MDEQTKHTPRDVNLALNQQEYDQAGERLFSTPREINLGVHNACNAKCIFCLEGKYSRFSLDLYKSFFEAKMGHFIRNAESVTLTGFGEILWVPGIEEFLDYLNQTLPNTKKIFTTNGTPLKSPVAERLLQSDYIIQISLHATTAATHEKLTLLEGQFEEILGNIRGLVAQRAAKRERLGLGDWVTHPFLRLFNVLNVHNIDELPDFIRMAYDLGVQGVRCFYMTMFAPEHIDLSCYFDQERANRAIIAAKEVEAELRERDHGRAFEVDLPPLFGEENPQAPLRCTDPWQYMYVELQGSVMPCCFWGEHTGNLNDTSVDDVWNGEFYRKLRKGMASGDPLPWCRNCIRYTGYNVNSLLCHLTNRPEVQKLLLAEISRRGLSKEKSQIACPPEPAVPV